MKLSCPFCGQHIEIETAGRYQCPACQKVFEVEEVAETAEVPSLPQSKPAADQVQQVAVCPYCTAPVSTAARKCPHCGEWIREKPKSKAVYIFLTLLFGQFGIGEMYIGNKFFYCVPTWIIPITISCISFLDKDFLIVMPCVAWCFSIFFCVCLLLSSHR